MRLDEAYSFISLSTIQCCQCGEVGHWEQIEWYSDRGGLWLLRCVDCEGEQYEDEYEQNYFECPDCGGEMTVTPYPNEDQLDGYMTYCPKCDN